MFEHFARECQRRGLRYFNRQVDLSEVFKSGQGGVAGGDPAGGCPFDGILGRADEYEGCVLLMAIDHVDCPCGDWYRNDWQEV